MGSNRRQGVALVLFAASAYALLPSLARNIYAISTMTPTDVAVWRFIFAVPAIWVMMALRGQDMRQMMRISPLQLGKFTILGALYAIAALTAFIALQMVTSTSHIVIFYTYPAMVALIALLLGRRLTSIAWAALCLVILGSALTVADFQNMQAVNWPSVGVLLINAAVIAVYYHLSSAFMSEQGETARGTAWIISATLVLLLLLTPVFGLNIPTDWRVWLNLLILGIICAALPIFALNTGIQKLGATQASIVSSVEPALVLIFAFFLLGESVLPVQQLGVLLTVLGVIIIQLNPSPVRKPAYESTPL